jgi:hypothetical protein
MPSLEELSALTHRLHQLEGRHTTRVDGQVVAAPCPPGERYCFCGSPESLTAHAADMRARIAGLTGGAAHTRESGPARREQATSTHAQSGQFAGHGRSTDWTVEQEQARREQLNRWHAQDQHAGHGSGRRVDSVVDDGAADEGAGWSR